MARTLHRRSGRRWGCRPGRSGPGPGHHHTGVLYHPVRQVAEGVGGELDVRVQDEVHPAVQQESTVLCPVPKPPFSVRQSTSTCWPCGAQGAVRRRRSGAGRCRPGWRCPPDTASADGGGCSPARSGPPAGLLRAVINYDTSRKFHQCSSCFQSNFPSYKAPPSGRAACAAD